MSIRLSLFCVVLSGLAFSSPLRAEETSSIPDTVLNELEFMVGRWETEMMENGEKVGSATHERKWSVDKHCLVFTWSMELHGEKVEATGISGWNPKGKAVVEHWYGSDGAYLSIRWPIGKMKMDAWEGIHRFVKPDGKESKSPCRLEKGDAQWIFTTEWEDAEGNKVSGKNITRKVSE